jgi:hypothetical protein
MKMYTVTNYKSKKEMVAAVKAGESVETYQPGGMFPAQRDGAVTIEGPHYPQPHRWYARVMLRDGIIVKVLS